VKWAQCDKTPIHRTVLMCLCVLMTVHSFSTQYNTEQFCLSPLLHPDKHHSSDVVYRRRQSLWQLNAGAGIKKWIKIIRTNCISLKS